MNFARSPDASDRRPSLAAGRGLVLALLLASLLPLGSGALGSAQAASPFSSNPTVVMLQTTTSFSYEPSTFTVAPGASVEVIVTQMTSVGHTFTIVDAVNATIPSSDTTEEMLAYIQLHGTIANQSIPATLGSLTTINFTAPSVQGAYEFLCEIHFPVMVGQMLVSSSAPPAGSSSSGLTTTEWIAIGAVVAVVVVAGVVVGARRRRPPTPRA